MPRRPHTNDLFELFPDLPWHGRKLSKVERIRMLQIQVDATRERARANIERQRAAAAAIRAALGTRRLPPAWGALVSARRRR